MNGIDKLKESILSKDKKAVLESLEQLREEIIVNDDTMSLITAPASITELHEMLVEHLSVNQRLMQLKNRVPNRKKRAMLFVQTMINGVNYLKDE